MERLLKDVARFATLLTRNPSTEDLLNSLMRDFLSRYHVSAIEIQLLGREGSLLIKSSVGQPIDGSESKNVASLSQLVSRSNLFGDLEESGTIFDPTHNLSIASINLDSSIKGFYLFQHSSVFTPDENSSDQLEVFFKSDDRLPFSQTFADLRCKNSHLTCIFRPHLNTHC